MANRVDTGAGLREVGYVGGLRIEPSEFFASLSGHLLAGPVQVNKISAGFGRFAIDPATRAVGRVDHLPDHHVNRRKVLLLCATTVPKCVATGAAKAGAWASPASISGMRARIILVVGVLLAGLGVAQQRSPLFATVTGPGGEPLADAEVTCSSPPTSIAPWRKDVVVARTDARGRARADLIVGRAYVAWAVSEIAETGESWVTAPHSFVAAGRVVALRALDKHGPRVVVLPGLAAWREVGGVGVRWYPDVGECVGVDAAMPDEGDRITVPATPWCLGAIAVTDANGEVMVCATLQPGSTEVRALGKPAAMRVNVRDWDRNLVANAIVSYRISTLGQSRLLASHMTAPLPHVRVVGKTNEAGQVRFHAPELRVIKQRFGDRQQSLLVCVDVVGFQQGAGVVGATSTAEVLLEKDEPMQVLVRGDGAEHASVAGVGSFSVHPSPSSHMIGRRALPTTRSHDNNWVVRGLRSNFEPCVWMATKRPTAVLTASLEAPTSPVVIDLDSMPRVIIAVTDADGGPAPSALLVGRPASGIPMLWEATLATDLSGHAQLHLGEGAYFVYALAGQSHALAIIDKDTVGPVKLRLAPVETMAIRVVGPDGKPIAGARVKGHSTSTKGGRDGNDLDSQWARMSGTMVWHFLQLVRSDDDGRIELPVFLRSGVAAKATVWLADRDSDPFQLRAGTALDVVLK